jgi:formate hydrogenlyase subunit 3/multisubunit Na+/H+ antiporter MnhD subunit
MAWLVWLPLAGGVLIFLLGRRLAYATGLVTAFATLLAALALVWQVWTEGPGVYPVGAWAAPLGIEFHIDAVSAVMLLLSAVAGAGVSLYALAYFSYEFLEDTPWRESDGFWPLWFFLWAALNALFLSADLFNLYVTLELVTLTAVALVILSGKQVSLTAGMRYLLAALTGSLLYLFGVALLYAAFGTLELYALGALTGPDWLSRVALLFMTVGLMIKTALFPFHFWLPPAHGSAPAPVSAVLSGLVVKASFYLILRLWFDAFPDALTPGAGGFVGALGAAAIVWGSLRAIAQRRLKLLIAYSTVAQIGYLFLPFAVVDWASAGGTALGNPLGPAEAGGLYHALAHGLAKAAMFMVAGVFIHATGSDRLKDLAGTARRLPLATLAFALGGWTLMGLPPSGGYLAKSLLLAGAAASGQWWWEVVVRAGGLLAALYVSLALRASLERGDETASFGPVPRVMQLVPLLLAALAALIGLVIEPPALSRMVQP